MEGKAKGVALVTSQPVSFWGDLDPKSGIMIERRHELCGESVFGKVLVFPYARESSTSSVVFLEVVRCDKAPIAIVNITRVSTGSWCHSR
jgi:predicted aconitase with swiveling domain